MKMYNNGPRKAMMYGGMSKRKPMMYGGMATKKKKPRKKAQAGGMMTATQGQQNQMQNQTMQKPKMPMMGMKGGGSLKMVEVNGKRVPEYAADGKGAKDLRKNMQEGGEARKTLSDQDLAVIRAGEMVAGKGFSKKEKKALEDAMGRELSDQDIKNIIKALQKPMR